MLRSMAFIWAAVAHHDDENIDPGEDAALHRFTMGWAKEQEMPIGQAEEEIQEGVRLYLDARANDEHLQELERHVATLQSGLDADRQSQFLEEIDHLAKVDGVLTDVQLGLVGRIGAALGRS